MSEGIRKDTPLPALESALVEFVTGLHLAGLGPDVLAGCRQLLQDQLAVQIGCAGLPWSQALLEYARSQHAPGAARVVTTADRMAAADAAFVNATFGHGFEYDDAHRESSSHPGCCVVPAALAVGEAIGATMGDVLVGMTAGYEVYTRIGMLAAPELLERGYHPHAILANFGAAAVVARMCDLDAATAAHALSIATSHCSGTTEYTSSGGSVKRVHAGIGTRNGIRAAELARIGITGPTGYLSGGKGFFRTFLQKTLGADAAAIFAAQAPFQIARQWIKPYCCCGCNHAYVDAARLVAPRVTEIDRIELGIQTGADVVVGNLNANAYAPRTIEHLQYSLPVQVALSVLGKGNGLSVHRDYLEGRLDLSEGGEVMALARRVTITRKPELDAAYPGKWVGDLTAVLRDGSRLHHFVEEPMGTVENPIPADELDAKFRDLTVTPIGAARAETLLELIKTFPVEMPVSEFCAHLGA